MKIVAASALGRASALGMYVRRKLLIIDPQAIELAGWQAATAA
jgi:hypothetical protein